jgi:hypothetical protein
MKIEANATTGEVIEREMTDAEIAQDLVDQAAAAAREAAEAQKAAERAALLSKLGITEDEAKLLLS